jgi:phage-related protein
MATELGQAYVQIMPSAKGISGSISKTLSGEATSAGKIAGSKLGTALKASAATAAAAIGATIIKSIKAGGELEQSIGGIETLFKDQAETVRKNAIEAYKTAGVSANEYMENVTSFSASLLQSMGGDTEKAAKVAHMAMVDMSDNANKMGTDMRDIQNAYGGFAKSNYTMLDNLKLGYAGTKGEMERLLKDAQELTGVEYNIDNLDDVFMAVHAIQEEIGITGTTALEAEETIQGSFAAMKAAFTNVFGALAIGEGLSESLKGLAETASTFLFDNLFPMVGSVINALPGAIVTFIQAAGPAFMEGGAELIKTLANGIMTGVPLFFETMAEFMGNVVTWLKEQLPTILKEGVAFISNFANGIMEGRPGVIESIGDIISSLMVAIWEALPTIYSSGIELIFNLAKGIWDNLPAVITSITNVLSNLLKTIIEHFPQFLSKGIEIVTNVAKGIWDNLPHIVSTLGNLLVRLIEKIVENLPKFLDKGFELIVEMAKGIVKAIPDIVAKIPEVVTAMVNKFKELISSFFDVGADIVKGLWNGINSVKNWILGKIGGFVDSIMGGIKNFFGISSPSKLMAKEVGKWIPIGLAEGIEDNIKPVTDAMNKLGELTTGTLESRIRVNSIGLGAMDQGWSNNNVINLTQNIYSPQALTPSEVARQSKNRLRQAAMEW